MKELMKMRANNQLRKGFIDPQTPCVKIVADATINNITVAYGKTIPLIILDTVDHPLIESMIDAHTEIEQGSVKSLWFTTQDQQTVYLQIEMSEPTSVKFISKFDSKIHAVIIDVLIHSQLLYLQAGKPGDRFIDDPKRPKILIEIPSSGFSEAWDKIYTQIFTNHFRKIGYRKKQAQELACNLRVEWSKIRNLHIY